MIIPKVLVPLVDREEKDPILFFDTITYYDEHRRPVTAQIRPETAVMRAGNKNGYVGDYTLKGFHDLVAFERKGCIKEIWDNQNGRDRARHIRAVKRLASTCKNPWFLLDFQITGMSKQQFCKNPEGAADEFYKIAAQYNIPIMAWPGGYSQYGRKLLGEQILRVMIATILHEYTRKEVLNGDTNETCSIKPETIESSC